MISKSFQRQRGLSLVELMVAMALSLLLMLGVIQIFLSSKQTYSTNSALSRVQESGRFAMDFLAQDIRNTGYKGQCTGTPREHGSIDALMGLEDPILGWDDIDERPAHLPNSAAGTPVAGTDAILIKFAAGPEEVAADSGNTASSLTISLSGTNKSGADQNALVLISDAINCDLFQNSASTNTAELSKDNASPEWTHNYTEATEILPLQNTTYYIRANPNGRPNSLVRQRLGVVSGAPGWLVPEELVEGVQDMQISYGIADVNRQVIRYDTAEEVDSDNNWNRVAAVRIDLLVVSTDTNVVPEAQVITFNGADETIDDRRLAQVFSTTIGIRNRLP